MKTQSLLLSSLLALAALSGCSAAPSMDIGAAPGGSQDIGYARDVIESGGVPASDSFRVGGLLNEHDLPIEGEDPCEQRLCITGASGAGRVPTLDQDAIFLQVGYDSDLTRDSLEREPLNLVVVVDISGSMGPYLEGIKPALHSVVDQLDADDTVSIVTYGSRARVAMRPTSGDNKDKLRREIDALSTGGSTDMESGMIKGFELIEGDEASGVESRMMLFTDVMPNVGATETTEFERIIEDAAEQGLSLSLFGVGQDFGYSIAETISQVRGGNYFYLEDNERIVEVFDEDFDLMVTPLAYDLSVDIRTSMAPIDGYNIQALADGDGGVVTLDVATVFANRNNGASMLLLELPVELSPEMRIAGMALSYDDPQGGLVEQEVDVMLGGDAGGLDGDVFAQTGTRKGAALVNMGLAMEAVCEEFHGEGVSEEVSAAYFESRDRLEAEAQNLEDSALQPEVELMDQLAENAGLVRPIEE